MQRCTHFVCARARLVSIIYKCKLIQNANRPSLVSLGLLFHRGRWESEDTGVSDVHQPASISDTCISLSLPVSDIILRRDWPVFISAFFIYPLTPAPPPLPLSHSHATLKARNSLQIYVLIRLHIAVPIEGSVRASFRRNYRAELLIARLA